MREINGQTESSTEGQPPLTGLRFGPYVVVPGQRRLSKDGEAVRMGSRALELLIVLTESAGEVVSNEELIRRVWGKSVVGENNLRVHIAGLRKALDEGVGGKRYVENIPLRGYCFVAPVTPIPSSDAHAERPTNSFSLRMPSLYGPLFGRDEAVDSLVRLSSKHRLVTIVGTGGIGKTSVGVAVAMKLSPGFEDGVLFVDLAPLPGEAHVTHALARGLGLDTVDADPMPMIEKSLQNKRMLLLFDNCDHVVDSAAALAETLLRQAPRVSIVATSREPLLAVGEFVHRLPPLALPTESDGLSVDEALTHSAVQLFVERAAAGMDGFELDGSNVRAVAHICRRLDGLPLAIELAAARVHAFGVNELAARLDDRLSLSMTGRRTALPRHQTLQAAIDWSYLTLSPAERSALCRLCLLSGQFTLDAALAVIGADAGDSIGHDILSQLIQKSLVHVAMAGAVIHYRLLETTRAYATRKLHESGEQPLLLGQHSER